MPRNRNIYNQIGLFIGSNISSGFHFLSSDGVPTNNSNPDTDFNLVFPINRVISANYGFNPVRSDIKSLGYFGTLSRPIINHDVNLNFSYYQAGLINEARFGMVFDHPTGNTSNGAPIYGRHVIPISGFLERSSNRSSEQDLNWPPAQREPKNIFIATRTDGSDLNDFTDNSFFKDSPYDVYAFGDCYLQNYKVSASVGQFPQVSVSFVCNNVEFYNYASGKNIPAVNPKDFTLIPNKTYNLPNNYQGTGLPTVLLPSNITATITKTNSSSLYDLPIDLNDIKIQSYDINIDLNRENLSNLGYRLSMDRRINLPVFANLDFVSIVGDSTTGSLRTLFKQDDEYNIKIKLQYSPGKIFDGTAIIYDFIGAKFNGMTLQDTIGQNRSANFSFVSEINPARIDKGFFISGQLGIPVTGTLGDILLGDDFFGEGSVSSLLTQNGEFLAISYGVSRPIY